MKTQSRIGFGLAVAFLLHAQIHAATFTVTNTGDSGAGSLRQAILDANGNAGADTIEFNVSGAGCDGAGVCTIAPTSQLPGVSGAVTIDGYTQPGASVNTAALGSNAVLKIVVSATNIPGAVGIVLSGGGATVKGLVINGGFHLAVHVLDHTATHVEGCFLGTDASGLVPSLNAFGVEYLVADGGGAVGGPALSQRNVIMASIDGVDANPFASLLVQNNLIGVDATGAAMQPPAAGGTGVFFGSAPAGFVPSVIRDNVIAGFTGYGIHTGVPDAIIQGNHIGVDASGTVVFPPTTYVGVAPNVGEIIGGVNPGEANIIAGMIQTGVVGDLIAGGTIRGNSIYGNGGIGIDMLGDGPTANDPLDADTIQNYPGLKSATTGASTHVLAVLHSAPSTTYDIDFYANPACTSFPRDFDEGQTYLGAVQVSTDGSGNASIDATLPVATEAGARISMTATNSATGRTSEFSPHLPFSVTPRSGPSTVGIPITIFGTDFAAGATVTIGGQPATGVSVSNSGIITATSPVLAAGTVNDLVVTNTDGTSGALVKGWVSDFLDVNSGNQFYAFVTKLVSNAITVGSGGGQYGVNAPTLRQQMAVFLLKAEHGLCYTPPACSGVFTDVLCSSNFAPWIEQMAAEGITGGCGGGAFCPTNPVRRDQMAVFLLKGEHGSTYVPPDCAGVFGDVACPSTFANWIERLAAENITGGCGGGNYCPLANNTRGQMAVFISKTFNLQ